MQRTLVIIIGILAGLLLIAIAVLSGMGQQVPAVLSGALTACVTFLCGCCIDSKAIGIDYTRDNNK
jgi:hypothetical protein